MRGGYAERHFDLAAWVRLLVAEWKWLLLVGVAFALAGAASIFPYPRQFVARATFLPTPVGSKSIAADFLQGAGLGIASNLSGGITNSPEIYPRIIESRRLLTSVLYTSTGDPRIRYPIADALGYVGRDSALEGESLLHKLRGAVDVEIDRSNGLVEVSVANRVPSVALTILELILERLEEYNRQTRQTQAGSARRFLEKRMAESRTELETAESNLVDFRSRNLRFANAPHLELEAKRLERRVALAELSYRTLVQQFELASIDEARDTPTFTIVEPPVQPAKPSGIGAGGRAIIGLFLGLACGAGIYFARSIQPQTT